MYLRTTDPDSGKVPVEDDEGLNYPALDDEDDEEEEDEEEDEEDI